MTPETVHHKSYISYIDIAAALNKYQTKSWRFEKLGTLMMSPSLIVMGLAVTW